MVDFKNIKMERAHFDAELYEKWSDWCNAHGYEIIENNKGILLHYQYSEE